MHANPNRPLKAQRQRIIMQELNTRKIVRVAELSRILRVVENTIRRDLKGLQKRGLIRRVHGGAMLVEMRGADDFPFVEKAIKFKAEKERIGIYASKLIGEDETIALDAGTTTLEVARHIPNTPGVMIVTNSIPAILSLEEKTQVSIVCPGGMLRRVSRSFLGSEGEEFLRNIHVDKLFLSAGGLTLNQGAQNPNIVEVAFKRRLIESADEVILVIIHDKIGKPSFAQICPLETIDKIITDDAADRNYIEKIRKRGINVALV